MTEKKRHAMIAVVIPSSEINPESDSTKMKKARRLLVIFVMKNVTL